MGYIKHKYNKNYYLNRNSLGEETSFGAEGIIEFNQGSIRKNDYNILSRLNFKNRNVLDLGFGRGEAIKFAIENGAKKVIGVDFSEDANEIASDFLKKYNLKADLYCMDALDFLKNYKEIQKFDIILMLDFIEHVPRKELTLTFNLLNNFITNNSIITINTPIFKIDNDVIANDINPLAKDTSDDYIETEGMHCNRYTFNSLQKYLKNLGFISISGHYFIKNFKIPNFLEGTKLAFIKAYIKKYPILFSAIFKHEIFEYAYSNEELQKIQNKFINKCKKFIKLSLKKMFSIKFYNLYYFFLKKIDKKISYFKILDGPLKDHYLSFNLNPSISWQKEMINGQYDYFIYDEIARYPNIKNAIIWDIGAHIGYHSLSFSSIVGLSGKIIAFEPNQFNIDRFNLNLKKNKELSKNIKLIKIALSNIDGEENFVFSSKIDDGRSSGSHLLNAFTPEDKSVYKSFYNQKIQTAKGDTLVFSKNIPMPSIIKLDVEGSEEFVLLGMEKILKSKKPLLLIEIHHVIAMHNVMNILLKMGYCTKILDEAPNSQSRCFIIAK